jgi:hypothetical protein
MTDSLTLDQFETDGYAVADGILSSEELRRVRSNVSELATGRAGTRKLLDAPWCQALARRLSRDPRVSALLPSEPHVVQCTLFEKTLDKNWLVPLHQDLSIPVAERVGSARCTGWSEKEGDVFVQPPVSVLAGLVAARVHLDTCDERNGAMRVVPGSHRLGRLNSVQAREARVLRGELIAPVTMGGVMVMRPLVLHASSKSSADLPRRVLHFVYGPGTLPEGLKWPPSSKLVV